MSSRPSTGGCAETAFDELMTVATQGADRFGHREHLHLTWLAVRRLGRERAIEAISAGIRRTARYAGVPQKYNATVSRAWVELVAHHQGEQPTETFEEFVGHHRALLDKRLLLRFYRPATLASAGARTGWVEPDLTPIPPVAPARS